MQACVAFWVLPGSDRHPTLWHMVFIHVQQMQVRCMRQAAAYSVASDSLLAY